jgi:hypothetical protein
VFKDTFLNLTMIQSLTVDRTIVRLTGVLVLSYNT